MGTMARVLRLVAMLSGVVAIAWWSTGEAQAIPSPMDHAHEVKMVHWKEAGSPDLPWTNAVANQWDHNHLTADDISNSPKWVINKAWDDRTLRSAFNVPADDDWAHGMILPGSEVRYGFDGGVPVDARNVVEEAYTTWVCCATAQFDARKDPWDRLAIGFERADNVPFEITIRFVKDLQVSAGAYGQFTSATRIIEFESDPYITVTTTAETKLIRIGDGGVGAVSQKIGTPWSYDGSAEKFTLDIDFSDDNGATWLDAPPVGFGNLNWNFGEIVPADIIDFFEMDFMTIALHEVGHSIALGHTGDGSAPIMRDDIASRAHFGLTMSIDDDSALAVAIDYTYSVPEPATLALLGTAISFARRLRRRRLH